MSDRLKLVSLPELGITKRTGYMAADGTRLLVGGFSDGDSDIIVGVHEKPSPTNILAPALRFLPINIPGAEPRTMVHQVFDASGHLAAIEDPHRFRIDPEIKRAHYADPKSKDPFTDFMVHNSKTWGRYLKNSDVSTVYLEDLLAGKITFVGPDFYARTIASIQKASDAASTTTERLDLMNRLHSEVIRVDEHNYSAREPRADSFDRLVHHPAIGERTRLNFAAEHRGNSEDGGFAVINDRPLIINDDYGIADATFLPTFRTYILLHLQRNEGGVDVWIGRGGKPQDQPTAHFELGEIDPTTATYPDARLTGTSYPESDLLPRVTPALTMRVGPNASELLTQGEFNRVAGRLGIEGDVYAGALWSSWFHEPPIFYDKHGNVGLKGRPDAAINASQIPVMLHFKENEPGVLASPVYQALATYWRKQQAA